VLTADALDVALRMTDHIRPLERQVARWIAISIY
jgi:hypothetical protein